MAEITETQREEITRTVVVKFDPSEFIPATGDRKPNGGYRVAQVTRVAISYDWVDGRWNNRWNGISAFREQLKANGEWSDPSWTKWPGIGNEVAQALIEAHTPTTTITITEKSN